MPAASTHDFHTAQIRKHGAALLNPLSPNSMNCSSAPLLDEACRHNSLEEMHWEKTYQLEEMHWGKTSHLQEIHWGKNISIEYPMTKLNAFNMFMTEFRWNFKLKKIANLIPALARFHHNNKLQNSYSVVLPYVSGCCCTPCGCLLRTPSEEMLPLF